MATNILEKHLGAVLSRTWWLLLLRGLFAIAFGALLWTQPGISLTALIIVFGAYVLADGLLGIWAAISARDQSDDWWVMLLWGFVGVGVGILSFVAPGITALALLFYIAAWAIATGVLQIMAAIRLRKVIDNEWWLILGGLLSVTFGVLLMARPGAGALGLLWLIGTYAIIFGVAIVLLAFKVRAFGHRHS